MSLMLGTVTFTDDEAPESITLGGEQAVAVRKYPGGGLDIQTLGAFDDAISWDGTLWFQDALARMQALNAIRIAALPVALQISSLSVQVVVTHFKATYINDFRIHYHIEMQPMFVLGSQMMGVTNPASTSTGISGGGTSETGSPTSGGIASLIQSAMTPAALGNSASIPPAYVTNNEFGSAALAPVGSIINQMSPATAAATSPALSTSTNATYLVQAGDSLWSIAAQFYGSGAQWTQIATANNIQDAATVTAGQQLVIPNPTQVV